MKLLFDQNVSRHLVGMFALEYPESRHVTDVGLDTATDEEIWAFASGHDFIIVSKDSDFRQLAFMHRVVDPAIAPEAAAENHRLRERVAQLEAERDRLWGQVERLQGRLRQLERSDTSDRSAVTDAPRGLPRAERRRLARELARRQRRHAVEDPLTQERA